MTQPKYKYHLLINPDWPHSSDFCWAGIEYFDPQQAEKALQETIIAKYGTEVHECDAGAWGTTGPALPPAGGMLMGYIDTWEWWEEKGRYHPSALMEHGRYPAAARVMQPLTLFVAEIKDSDGAVDCSYFRNYSKAVECIEAAIPDVPPIWDYHKPVYQGALITGTVRTVYVNAVTKLEALLNGKPLL